MSALKINIVLFGIDDVGSTLIKKVIKNQKAFLEESNIDIRFPIITNSTLVFFEKQNSKNQWEYNSIQPVVPFRVGDIIEYTYNHQLENLIAVDSILTADIVKNYSLLITNGFDVVTTNNAPILSQNLLNGKEIVADNILADILEIVEKIKMSEAV